MSGDNLECRAKLRIDRGPSPACPPENYFSTYVQNIQFGTLSAITLAQEDLAKKSADRAEQEEFYRATVYALYSYLKSDVEKVYGQHFIAQKKDDPQRRQPDG